MMRFIIINQLIRIGSRGVPHPGVELKHCEMDTTKGKEDSMAKSHEAKKEDKKKPQKTAKEKKLAKLEKKKSK